MTQHEHVYDHRVSATRGIVSGILDTGIVQTADVQTHDGVIRGNVEVYQMFGVTSVAPGQGSTMVLLANGGDESDMIGLPAACAWARLGGLAAGETAIYAVDGTRIHLKLGGIVEILAATQVLITAPNGVQITADVSITGGLTTSGNISVGTGATGNFTTPTGQCVTVQDGIITNIF